MWWEWGEGKRQRGRNVECPCVRIRMLDLRCIFLYIPHIGTNRIRRWRRFMPMNFAWPFKKNTQVRIAPERGRKSCGKKLIDFQNLFQIFSLTISKQNHEEQKLRVKKRKMARQFHPRKKELFHFPLFLSEREEERERERGSGIEWTGVRRQRLRGINMWIEEEGNKKLTRNEIPSQRNVSGQGLQPVSESNHESSSPFLSFVSHCLIQGLFTRYIASSHRMCIKLHICDHWGLFLLCTVCLDWIWKEKKREQ